VTNGRATIRIKRKSDSLVKNFTSGTTKRLMKKNIKEKMTIRVKLSAVESLRVTHDQCIDSSKSATWESKKIGIKKSRR
jgi:hypothetical protein